MSVKVSPGEYKPGWVGLHYRLALVSFYGVDASDEFGRPLDVQQLCSDAHGEIQRLRRVIIAAGGEPDS